MNKGLVSLFLIISILCQYTQAGINALPDDKVDTGREVAAINDNFTFLQASKIDANFLFILFKNPTNTNRLAGLTPDKPWEVVINSDTAKQCLCISTGPTIGAWVIAHSTNTECDK